MFHTAYGIVCPPPAQCIWLSTVGILGRLFSHSKPGLCSLYFWKLPSSSHPHRSTHALTRFEPPPLQSGLARVYECLTPRRSYGHSANEGVYSRTQDSKIPADIQTAAEGVPAWKTLGIAEAADLLLRRWRFPDTGHAMGPVLHPINLLEHIYWSRSYSAVRHPRRQSVSVKPPKYPGPANMEASSIHRGRWALYESPARYGFYAYRRCGRWIQRYSRLPAGAWRYRSTGSTRRVRLVRSRQEHLLQGVLLVPNRLRQPWLPSGSEAGQSRPPLPSSARDGVAGSPRPESGV